MKTRGYDLDMLTPNNSNKDYTYNENITKIDCLMDMSALDFVDSVPSSFPAGSKYIITNGEKQNQICYKTNDQKPPLFLKPLPGKVLFVLAQECFYRFDGENWKEIAAKSLSGSITGTDSGSAGGEYKMPENMAVGAATLLSGNEKFSGIEGEYYAPHDYEFLHLYVSNDVQVNLDKVQTRLVTFIIKQHYQTVKKFNWPDNILWQNKTPHKLTAKANATDIVRIYRLVETNHFLGEIVGQDYQF